jgi:AcrR family transcriptional regulator
MDDVAAEAGITKPVLYDHFGGKNGLALAMAERYAPMIRARMLAALGQPGEPRDLLRGAVDAFIGFVEAEPEVYRFLLQRGVRRADEAPQRQLFDELGAQVATILSMAVLVGRGDPRAAEPWAFALLGAVLAAAEWWATHQTMTRAELVDHVADLLWGGVASASPAVRP